MSLARQSGWVDVVGEIDHRGLGIHAEGDGDQLGVHGVDQVDQDFLAAAGMSVLVIASEDADGSTRFAVIAGPAASRLITIVGLNSTLPVHPSLGAPWTNCPEVATGPIRRDRLRKRVGWTSWTQLTVISELWV